MNMNITSLWFSHTTPLLPLSRGPRPPGLLAGVRGAPAAGGVPCVRGLVEERPPGEGGAGAHSLPDVPGEELHAQETSKYSPVSNICLFFILKCV